MENNKLDTRSFIAMGLISAIMMVYFFFFSPSSKQKPEDKKAQTEQVDTKKQAETPKTVLDSLPAQSTTAQNVILQNKELQIVFSSQGAQPKSVKLIPYTAYAENTKNHRTDLYLLNGKNSDLNVVFTENGKKINSRDLIFTPVQEGNKVTFVATSPAGGKLSFIYTLKENYIVDFDIQSQGITVSEKPSLSFSIRALEHEKGRKSESMRTDVHYAQNNFDKYSYVNGSDEEAIENTDYVAYKGQFFSVILDNMKGFGQSKIKVTKEEDKKSPYLSLLAATSTFKEASLNADMQWYFGPNDKSIMKLSNRHYEKVVSFGWFIFGYLNEFFFAPLFKFLNGLGWFNGGIIILIMTILVKLITAPITYKQYRQSAMMRVLKPELDEINEKNKDADPLKKQQATMDLYRKAGVNPTAGCIPALLQMPIFMALLNLFPNLIELRGKSFLWADDLSAYDSIYSWTTDIPIISSFYGNHISLFTILYAASLFLLTKIQGVTAQAPQQEGMPDMRFMVYLMPIMMLFFANELASALSWYYVVSNVITIGLVLVIKNYFIDEDKIHAQLQENKTKPEKKKSKFSQLLEEAQRQQALKQAK